MGKIMQLTRPAAKPRPKAQYKKRVGVRTLPVLEPCNRINIYSCPEHDLVTVDRVAGTTPALMKCPECGKPSVSRWHRVDQALVPEYEWVQPPAAHLAFMPISLRDHVLNGGLILLKIEHDKVSS
jgi:hypothetical protein